MAYRDSQVGEQIYVTLSSSYVGASGSTGDFITAFDVPMELSGPGKWSVALFESEFVHAYAGPLYLYSTVAGFSNAGSQRVRLVARIPSVAGTYYKPPAPLQWAPVEGGHGTFRSIELNLKDSNNTTVNPASPAVFTLVFRRVA